VDATAIANLIPGFKLNPKGIQISLFDDFGNLSANNLFQRSAKSRAP
jgi:hypothetical protein